MNYYAGNVVKYVMRYQEKNGKQDLKKAKHYLKYMISNYERIHKNMINFKGLKQYLLNRANEVSTWRGVVLLLAATGSVLTPDQQELIVTLGIGVAV